MNDFGTDFASAMDMMSVYASCGFDNVPGVQLEYADDAKEFIDKVGELTTSVIIDKYLGTGKTKELLEQEIAQKVFNRRRRDSQISLGFVSCLYRRIIFSFMKDAEEDCMSSHQSVGTETLKLIRKGLSEYLYRDGKDYTCNKYGRDIMDSMIVRRTKLVERFAERLRGYEFIDTRFVDHGFAHFLLYGGTKSNDPNFIYKNGKVIDGFRVCSSTTKEDLYAQVCAGAAPNLGFNYLVKIWCMNVSYEEVLNTAITALSGPFMICGRTFDSEMHRYLLIKNLIFTRRLCMEGLTEKDVESIMGEDYERFCKSVYTKCCVWASEDVSVKGYKVLMCALRDERVRDFLIQYLKDGGIRLPYYDGELGCFSIVKNPYTEEYELIKPTAIGNINEGYSTYVRRVLAKSIGKVEGSKEPILVRDTKHYKYLLEIEEPSVAYAINGMYFYLRHLAIEKGATTQQELIDVADKFYDGIAEMEQYPYAWREQLSGIFYKMAGVNIKF